jgi:hypothetical protein
MINVAGAPSTCLDPSHVQFSWTEGGQVADAAVTTAKIADRAVTFAKMDLFSVGLFQMRANSVGPQALGLQMVTVNRVPTNPGLDRVIVTCPAGKRVMSGGYRTIAVTGQLAENLGILENGPLGDTQWVVHARWPGLTAAWEWEVYAICTADGTGP